MSVQCPRCGEALRPPTLMHEQFHCPRHGAVAPLHEPVLPVGEALTRLAAGSEVPYWLPWPLPARWLFTGLRLAGGGKEPVAAVVIGLSGQALAEGPADLLIVAEIPGTGLGAHLAGVAEPDPGFTALQAATKIRVGGWPTPLWTLPTEGPAAYVGEAAGQWLWLIAWPEAAWTVIHDNLHLVDLRDCPPTMDVPAGALMPRLVGRGGS